MWLEVVCTAPLTAGEWSDHLSGSSHSFREEKSKIATSAANVKRCVAGLGP